MEAGYSAFYGALKTTNKTRVRYIKNNILRIIILDMQLDLQGGKTEHGQES